MRRVPCLSLSIAIIALSIASQAFGQYTDENPRKYSVYAGVYMPSGSLLRDSGSAAWKQFGVALNTNMDEDNRPGAYIGLDYASVSDRGYQGNRIGLNYTKLFHSQVEEGKGQGLYYGLGAGFSWNSSEIKEQLWQDPPISSRTDSGLQYAVTGICGYDFGEIFYAELRYTQTTKLAPDVDFSGLTLLVGTRSLF